MTTSRPVVFAGGPLHGQIKQLPREYQRFEVAQAPKFNIMDEPPVEPSAYVDIRTGFYRPLYERAWVDVAGIECEVWGWRGWDAPVTGG
jgi:hypothetical protein